MRNETEKRIGNFLDAIENLKTEQAYSVLNEKSYLKDSKAISRFKENEFEIKVITGDHPSKEDFDNPFDLLEDGLKLYRSENEYFISIESIKSLTQTFSDPFIATYRVAKFVQNSNKTNSPLLHTAILEIPKIPDFDSFPVKPVKIGEVSHYRFFSLNLFGISYDCYCHENEDLKKVYLFIEACNVVAIDQFQKNVESILYLIALFTGNWYKENLFIISKLDDDEWWKYESILFQDIGESILTDRSVCDRIRCSQLLEHINRKDLLESMCSQISLELLSSITEKISANDKIKRIIELMLEGLKANSVVLKSSIFSVALEYPSEQPHLFYLQNRA